MDTITDKQTSSAPVATGRKNFCVYEPIKPRIKEMRVVLVDSLIGDETHFSDEARRDPEFDSARWFRNERKIAKLALANIEGNVARLVERPEVRVAHFSEVSEALVGEFQPDAFVLSGTLRDFDYYDARLFENFNRFAVRTGIPILAICGGHQMIGQAFGAEIVTLDRRPPRERRTGRLIEYQYRFVTITDPSDPIFAGLHANPEYDRWHQHTRLMRVWQNHGLQLANLPPGFKHLARGYLSEIQMMVRRTSEQLIYGVQFHIEKSFQDWQLDNYWEHRVESRDGRLIFENFLIEALKFSGQEEKLR